MVGGYLFASMLGIAKGSRPSAFPRALWRLGATVPYALQTLFGVIGIGLTVVIFVILGNPSAGGAYQPSVLPPFWRAISSYLPNGAGTDAIRRIVYFDGHGITHSVVVLVCWIVGGVLVTMIGAAVMHRGSRETS